ncbi:hypothetical protein FHS15_003971 [Paenibacillus castaneae]|uniref:hypothetical protein n=1 Tax=Paenibacillus castaneae TaxID=474957 RepID=UPI000C9BCE16|nr:hypothetical protein [Paenibacillus castaneae]NIK78825.1 hypothetical protein [Paenibacillus castaneae]
MFQNKLRDHSSAASDPFATMGGDGEAIFSEEGANPFEEMFTQTEGDAAFTVNPEQHFVNPHYVESYYREDGTYVEGYWRDGDGDTSVDLQVEDGGGYMQTNPDDDLTNNLDFSNVLADLF